VHPHVAEQLITSQLTLTTRLFFSISLHSDSGTVPVRAVFALTSNSPSLVSRPSSDGIDPLSSLRCKYSQSSSVSLDSSEGMVPLN
jgi:hypothetical protein